MRNLRCVLRVATIVATVSIGGCARTESTRPAPEFSIKELSRIPAVLDDEVPLFFNISNAFRCENGDFVVLDNGDLTIKRVSPKGSVRMEFGGKGTGPGRFRQFTKSGMTSEGTLYIIDLNTWRLTRWESESGNFETVSITDYVKTGSGYYPICTASDGSSVWYVTSKVEDPSTTTGSSYEYEFVLVPWEQDRHTTITRVKSVYRNQRVNINGSPTTVGAPFAPNIDSLFLGEDILLSFSIDYELLSYEPGEEMVPKRHLIPAVPQRVLDSELAEIFTESTYRSLKGEMDFPATKAFVRSLVLSDQEEHIWVERYGFSLAENERINEEATRFDLIDLGADRIQGFAILNKTRLFASSGDTLFVFSNSRENQGTLYTAIYK